MRKIVIIDCDIKIPEDYGDVAVYMKTGKQSTGINADVFALFKIALRMRPDVIEVIRNSEGRTISQHEIS